ncbi:MULTISPECIES: DUF6401 family natural product biosynthesis protein [unclassified Nocardia]|uniref:DUF6401 family natural product biosynthesis protein n=1 Tax=unclassified Nocardia TaxID=2637762 RepID=UPI001CE408A4|nr:MULTISPECIES: DUF6401 family natural product biosynthesis protein [unclassified Nocardia]
MFLLGPALLEVSAHRILTRLHRTHGVPALAAAAQMPALLARLDQHAAAVRDILAVGVPDSAKVPAGVLLAGYVRGLLDEARTGTGMGSAPSDLDEWAEADWLQLRLAGVCLHAARQAA